DGRELQLAADALETRGEKRGLNADAAPQSVENLIEAQAEQKESAGEKPLPAALFHRFMMGITRNVVVLGLVSFFTDVSSEMIVPVRILFFVAILRTPLPVAGLIEGVAESTASLLKVVSGRLADRVSRRKPLILFGYSTSNL